MADPISPTVELANGARMPRLGLGTFPMDDAEAEGAIAEAIDIGYRLIDTAENYGNEVGVGRGVAAAGVDREEIFLTTKLNAEWHSVDGVRETFEASARRLGVDYIDMLLIHWPNPQLDRYVDAYLGLVKLLEEGKLRAIGFSNFLPEHVERVQTATDVVPDVDQIELHPWAPRNRERRFNAEHGIVTQSWSPIGQGRGLLAEDVITEIAARANRTPAQVVLRWHLQLGACPIPKSSNPERMAENLDVFSFELDDAAMARISALARPNGTNLDPETFGH